jgi:hypothetical protein
MTQFQVLESLCEAGQDTTSEGHFVARHHGRVTVPMISAAMARKGGLWRISAAAASRAKARAKSVAKFDR